MKNINPRLYRLQRSMMQFVDSQEKWIVSWEHCITSKKQVKLYFASRDDAINYLKEEKLDFEEFIVDEKFIHPKSYSDNF